MSERNGSKTISEGDFKRLCGQVWADSLSSQDLPDARPQIGEESILLRQVLTLVRDHLELGGESVGLTNSGAYLHEIDDLMGCYAHPEFDHNRIIGRLLREVLEQQVA